MGLVFVLGAMGLVGGASAEVSSRPYFVLSDGATDGDLTWLRNPKTATTAFVYGVAPLKPCGGRLLASEKHEVGCVRSACGDEEVDRLQGVSEAQRAEARRASRSNAIVTMREPVSRFRSAWTFLRAKHPNMTAWATYRCVGDLASALDDATTGTVERDGGVKRRVEAIAAIFGERRYKAFALWPQQYWINPLVAPTRHGAAVVVCYSPDLLKRTTTALRDVFGCALGAAANVSFTTNTHQTALSKVQPQHGHCDEDPQETRRTDDAIRRIYADDVRAWAAYCALPQAPDHAPG